MYYREGLKRVFSLDEHVAHFKKRLSFEPPSKTQRLLQKAEKRVLRTMLADCAFGHIFLRPPEKANP
jgi:transposase